MTGVQTCALPILVIIDTVARALPAGSDENSAKDMGEFINAVDTLRERFGCVVCLVHHTGHSIEAQARARGSSTFRAAMDWEILVDKKRSQIRWTKMKDAEIPDALEFSLEQVGESAVAVFGKKASQPAGPSMTKAEELGVSTLQEACQRLGRGWASVEEWRVDFYRRHHADCKNTKRRAFNRTREGLIEKGLLHLDNDVYRLAGRAGQGVTCPEMSRGTGVTTGTHVYRTCPDVPHPVQLALIEK